ncbi:hypothetical protein BDB00DRAFT_449648 [Zychaea mexicana]|uniref:uncharacterized protein n=1 Tax=Zychaea mexicana TaxID=64656 RepID=UPI0022FDCDD3|nr:uncharacterized protein BDB00DRAFT_449648 [Zychaea mexicana]KAI9498459.1 hypothetical protein BDB00DRAFT_449648 [Zychaea mexicana]
MKYTAVCKALYDYKAQSDEELTFSEDNILYILDKDDDPDWWKAQLKTPSLDQVGPIGLVPANYIDEAEPIGTIEALYDYTAQQDEELSFKENDIMVLYENDDPDWFLAKEKGGTIGLVPSNYIQEVSNKAVTRSSAHDQLAASATAVETAAASDSPSQEAQQPSVSVFSAISNSPSIAPAEQSRAIPHVNDEAVSWPVHEYDVDKKKKKKSKGNLLIGNGMLCYGSETDKASPVRQFAISDVGNSAHDGKNIHIEISDATRSTLDFQASSKSEAKAIISKIDESKSLAISSANAAPAAAHQTPAPAPAPVAAPVVHEPEPKAEPAEPACEPRWSIALYDFTAEGPEEISIKENDQVLAVDYVSSEDWWTVEYQDGRSGIVPATYVQFQEDYEAEMEQNNAMQRQQEEEQVERQRREAEAAAARQRRLEEEEARRRREQEERARREEVERRRRQEEEVKRKEQERKAAAAASAPLGGGASPRRSQIPAPPPPNKPPAGKAMPSAQAVKSIPLPNNRSLPERPKQAQDPGKPDPIKVRTWTDRSGAFRVEAQFLGCHGDKIRLHKLNGVKIDVPIQKMCMEDLRYIEQETGQRLFEDSGDDIPLAHFAKDGRSSNSGKQNWSWYDYFMRANIPMNNSLRYASTFQAEGLGKGDLENLTHRKMKSLGMSESHVQRLQRFIETNVPEPASDEESMSHPPLQQQQQQFKKKGKKSVSFGATSVIDDSEDESTAWAEAVAASRNAQSQIEEDERLARQLQEQFNSQQESPVLNRGGNSGGLQRRGTGRPTPSNVAPRGVNTAMMDKIKTQLSSTPLQPTPAASSSTPPATQAPPATPPRDPVVSIPPVNGPIATQSTGFADDAWAPRATSSPNKSSAVVNTSIAPPPVGDAMAQTKAAWSAPPPPPPPPAPPAPAMQQQQQQQQQPMMAQNHVPAPPPSQPPVPLPPRQRPTPPTPQQNNKVDVQMLSQWTSPAGGNHQQQQQPPVQSQPSHVQQMAMQFGNQQQQHPQQQAPPPPPRSPMNQFVSQAAPPPPPAQSQFMQTPAQQNPAFAAHSPVQQNQFIPQQAPQQQQQAPMMMHQQQQPNMLTNVPINAALPQPLVPTATGMSNQSSQSGEGRTWANASK